jgi:hypothetical protein
VYIKLVNLNLKNSLLLNRARSIMNNSTNQQQQLSTREEIASQISGSCIKYIQCIAETPIKIIVKLIRKKYNIHNQINVILAPLN